VNYALGTVDREQSALERVRAYRPITGTRFLDAGCAYGGFLAAASQAGAAEVVGFDIDDRLLDIARSYLTALDIRADLRHGNVVDEAFMDSLGTFEIITCNDVIEHVNNVPKCIANLAGALKPGGILYMAIPNKRSPMLVRSDPHFHLFGMVLLPRSQAMRYHALVTKTDRYDVGDFFDFDDYLAAFRAHGLEVTVPNAPKKTAHWCIRELQADFEALRTENDRFDDERLPPDLTASIRQAVSATIDLFEQELAEYQRLLADRQNDQATAKSLTIARDFYLSTWYVIARKVSREAKETTV